MTHPLPDEICEQIRDSIPKLPCDEHGKLLSYDGQRILDGMFEELSEVSNAEMRAAANWQLEQVVKALNQCKEEKRSCIEVIYLFHEKLEAMCPTTKTQEEN